MTLINTSRITERAVVVLVAIMLLTGFILFHTDLTAFNSYIQEDGIVEWMTVAGLLLASLTCFRRFISLRKKRSRLFLAITFLGGAFLFFAAGEEISWGQRILGISSSDFFQRHNAQGETNLHNLVVGGRKINKIIFSIGLVSFMALYLLLCPLLYRYSYSFKELADGSGIPVPKFFHVVCIVVLFALTEMIPHGKRAELLEAGGAWLVLLILLLPVNRHIFHRQLDNNRS